MLEKAATQRLIDYGFENPALCGNLAIAIKGQAEELLGDGINHHVARPGVEGNYLLGFCACWNSSQIANAAQVLQDASATQMAEEQVIQKGN